MSELVKTSSNTMQIAEELTEMLKNEFTTEEQQIFVRSFHMYLLYGNDDTKFVVKLDDVWLLMGFSSKGTAKRALVKDFDENEDFTTIKKMLVDSAKQVHGGHNKEEIMMNVNTFKAMCMIAQTENGKKVRKYYIKMESIFFKYIEHKNKQIILTIEENAKKTLELDHHNTLKNSNKNTPCVYLLKITFENDDNFIVKIGETDDIEQRVSSLRQEYKNCMLLDVFPCNRPHKFEQYILHRQDVSENKMNEMITISTKFTYKTLIKIIKDNIDYFDGIPFQHKLELTRNKLELERLKYKSQLIDIIKITDDTEEKNKLTKLLTDTENEKDEKMENNLLLERKEKEYTIPETNRRVYKYDPNNLINPIEIYKSIREAARSIDCQEYYISDAINTNKIFYGYRWYLGTTTLPDTIPDTTDIMNITKKRTGLIAQINPENNKIINVFLNRRTASIVMKMATSSISYAIDKNKQSFGFYWKMYADCDETLKQTFIGELPEDKKTGSPSSKSVHRIDPETNKVVEIFTSIQDINKKYGICHRTINNLSLSGDIYKNFIWKLV
jgi:phage anti-repressor protein